MSHDLEEVVDIFGRLNSKGTRVRETDIYLGVVAARDAGWVRDEFMPFLERLEERGFDVTPNLLFQSVAAIGASKAKFKEINESFWTKAMIAPAWSKTRAAWQHVVDWLGDMGILTVDLLPSQSALIPAAALFSRYPAASRPLAFEWLIQALRYGRYSGASHTAIEEDLREVDRSSTAEEAIGGMRARIRAIEEFGHEFFLRDYSEGKFGRLILYLLAFRNAAQDWDGTDRRIAFEGEKLAPGYDPQFHHVFPRKLLRDRVEETSIEALANIAIIGGSTNLKISAQDPLNYFDRYRIDAKKRAQQYVHGDIASMTPANYPDWLRVRAERLATAANAMLTALRPV